MKTLPTLVLAFFVGLVELVLIFAVGQLLGSELIAMAGGLFLMSIVCTAGISLVIYAPVVTGLGMVTLMLIGQVFPAIAHLVTGQGAGSSKGSTPSSGSSLSTVSRYVERMQGAGVPDEMILARLKRAGWSEGETRSAMNRS